MNYTELLNRIIKESNLTNVEIVRKCGEIGQKITTNYLSILKNDVGRIPSEDISKAIAQVCNAEQEDILVIQGYLDKAPKKIVDFINNVFIQSKNMAYKYLESQKENISELEYQSYIDEYNSQFSKMTLSSFISSQLNEELLNDISIDIKNTSEKSWIAVPLDSAKFLTKEQIKALG